MVPNVLVCITTRDGKPDFDVYRQAQNACQYAASTGTADSKIITAQDPYSVATCRNRAVTELLRGSFTHLFFIDNDVHVQADAIAELVRMDVAIAAGCYPSFKTPRDNSYLHQAYITLQRDEEWFMEWFDGVVEVHRAGTGCMLIRRDVLERLEYPWFVWREYLENGCIKRLSDDVDFCDRAREAGFSIFANGNIRCSHFKTVDAANFMFEGRRLESTWTGPQTVSEQESWPAYGSHVPAIETVLANLETQRVVEYGAGRYSTPAFLRSPDVESVVSYESNLRWLQDTQRLNQDDRLTTVLCPLDEMPNRIHAEADLVFIDCDAPKEENRSGRDYTARLALVKAYESVETTVMIHDCNFEEIKPTLDASRYRWRAIYTPPHGPQTAVLSNSVDVSGLEWVESKRKRLARDYVSEHNGV